VQRGARSNTDRPCRREKVADRRGRVELELDPFERADFGPGVDVGILALVEPHLRDDEPLLVDAGQRLITAELLEGEATEARGSDVRLAVQVRHLREPTWIDEHEPVARVGVVVGGHDRRAAMGEADGATTASWVVESGPNPLLEVDRCASPERSGS
jgi:hypothetical protein